MPRLSLVVSIDGLQPEHDVRRTPATYDRILKHIAGHTITVHCTVTRQQVNRAGYIEEFLHFWSARPEVEKIWVSLYTPQIGEVSDERLRPVDRERVVADLLALRLRYPEAGAAERADRRLRQSARVARRVRLRQDDDDDFRRPDDADHAVPVRRQRPTAATAAASRRPAWPPSRGTSSSASSRSDRSSTGR